jgi:septal ring factor EnvC (AmiA/AmiB activator)
MTDDVANLTLEILRRMDSKLDKIQLELLDFKMRVSALWEHMSGLTISIASLNTRVDRIEGWLDRIERRLDLVEAH